MSDPYGRLQRGCSTAIITLMLAIGLSTPRAVGAIGVEQRPISDFLDAQGTTNVFIPPQPDFIGWTNNNPQTAIGFVDYAGVVAAYVADQGGPVVGTRVSGNITERALRDGRAQVTIIVKTTNALSWAHAFPSDVATEPLQFGYRGTDLIADPSLTPALSRSEFKVVFKNTAVGAPLPDLVDAFILGNALPGQEIVSFSFHSTGTGPLRAPFGVPEGTQGHLTVTQTGLFMTSFMGATADAFPAERVELRVTGGSAIAGLPTAVSSRVGATTSRSPSLGNAASLQSTWGRLKALYRH